ncbi:hypothetical protein OPIT5_22425 [Opitutaceae bacterium TAV5]|nr:hypothetical protein OPIT5_22425 [Opitutaceae bacterium TAV5]
MKSSIKVLVWLYLALLLAEGALRKWAFPGLADPLLIVRDPVVLAIYALALASGIFPANRFMVALAALAGLSVIVSFLGGHDRLLVIAYGLRINYLHLPLIWIMGAVLDRRDVGRIGAGLLVAAIPMTLVMVAQFRAPMDAFINHGVGNDEVGQIFGADGRIRPPGLFAFITGPQLFYPLCAAFFFNELGGTRRLPWYVLIVCGLAIAIALPVSISRTVMLGTAVVAATWLVTLPFASSRFSSLARPLLLLAVVGAALSQLPIFREGAEVFMMRWDTAESDSGGAAWGGVIDRTVNGFTNPAYFLRVAPFFGHGIGTGSNVGARLTSGEVGFALAEEEWGKVILELGPGLGAAFILFRIVLTGWLGLQAWRALRAGRDALPLLIFAATALTILQGQWAPPTVLGFAVAGGGLLLGALNPAPVPAAVEENHADTPAPDRPPAHSVRRVPGVPRVLQK